jgi:hypothetical protein
MSNLIPELRADKNGKLVTKHVRATAKGSDAKIIPSPALSKKPSKAATEKRVKSILDNIGDFKGSRARIETRLREMDPEILGRIETLAQGTEETKLWEDTHSWLVHDIIIEPSDENRLLCLNAVDAFDDDYQEWADIRSLLSLRSIPEFAPYAEDFREAPADVMDAARRLGEYRTELQGLVRLASDTRKDNRLKSRELEATIINEPEKASELLDWLASNADKSMHQLDSELAMRVINRPEDRADIAEMLGSGVTATKIISLVLDRPESRDQIFELFNGGIRQIPAILEVIDGNVKSSLASGIL